MLIYKKGVLQNFEKPTGKYLCRSRFLKKRLRHRCFPVNFENFLKGYYSRRLPFKHVQTGGRRRTSLFPFQIAHNTKI